jgi:hypothetical protein
MGGRLRDDRQGGCSHSRHYVDGSVETVTRWRSHGREMGHRPISGLFATLLLQLLGWLWKPANVRPTPAGHP